MLEPPVRFRTETTIDAAYNPLPEGAACVIGIGDLTAPAVEVHTAAKQSSTASAWRRAYKDTGTAISLDPQHEDFARSGIFPVLFSGLPTQAYVIRLDHDRSGLFVETDRESTIVTGPFERNDAAEVAAQLKVR